MNNNPIAVVDSGVGGLTCLKNIRLAMPNEDIIYFADTKNMPYGDKSKEEICELASTFAKYLKSLSCKMIILACGTLSSNALDELYKVVPDIIICDIISPAISSVARNCKEEEKIAFLATPSTIKSGVHKAAFDKLKKHYNIYYRGCDDLSVMIEKGVLNGPLMEKLLRYYLDDLVNVEKVTSVFLACTHYPLVCDCIKKLYPELNILEPSNVLAKNSKIMLDLHDFSAEEKEGKLSFFVTKKTQSFDNMLKLLGYDEESKEVSF